MAERRWPMADSRTRNHEPRTTNDEPSPMKPMKPAATPAEFNLQAMRLRALFPEYQPQFHYRFRDEYEARRRRWQRELDLAKQGKVPFPNARFWEFVNMEWVRITLRPGQKLAWRLGGRHDEGWTREFTQFEYVAEVDVQRPMIICFHEEDGTDCDGRMTRRSLHECVLEHLDFQDPVPGRAGDSGIPVPRPRWVARDQDIRDYAAEAAGY